MYIYIEQFDVSSDMRDIVLLGKKAFQRQWWHWMVQYTNLTWIQTFFICSTFSVIRNVSIVAYEPVFLYIV